MLRILSVHFQALITKKISCKDYYKRITTRGNGNVQSHDQEESKLNSTITASSDVYTLTHEKSIHEKERSNY